MCFCSELLQSLMIKCKEAVIFETLPVHVDPKMTKVLKLDRLCKVFKDIFGSLSWQKHFFLTIKNNLNKNLAVPEGLHCPKRNRFL